MKFNKSVLLAGLLSMLAKAAVAIELPEGFVDEVFVSGLEGQITSFDSSSQGRIFISEKSGIVRVAVNDQLLAVPFLDLRDIVNDRVDRGMLSVAVHPQFPQLPYVYVLYTYDPPELLTNNLTGAGVLDGNGNRVSRLVRYTADASRDFTVAVNGSEQVILGSNSTFDAIGNPEERFDTLTPSCGVIGSPLVDCLPSDEITHTIGALRFAPDETLYVTNGDGASYRTFDPLSQMTYDIDSLRGKILRVDALTGLGLPDNPFYDGDPSSNRSRVISYGLRNPYSMTIHPITGEPYVGEVGDKFWEEINVGTGKNFGWPCYEGGGSDSLRKAGFEEETFCQELYRSNEAIEAPLISWEHEGNGNAGIIGDFYFGEVFPDQYRGKLFYGDFIQGWMRYADVSGPGNITEFDFATDMLPMVELRTGADGALYYASITTGEIRRIRFVDDDSTQGAGEGEDPGGETPDGETPPVVQPEGESAERQVSVGLSSSFLQVLFLCVLMSRRRHRSWLWCSIHKTIVAVFSRLHLPLSR
ncbi:MAG: sorbosone dehydrogenase family protein [Granulosicoccus sp.]